MPAGRSRLSGDKVFRGFDWSERSAVSGRAWIVHPVLRRDPDPRATASRLDEAEGLARAIDLDIAGISAVPVRNVRPARYFGSGKISEIGDAVHESEADLVIVNAALTPVQQRNLETAWQTKVIDRTGLILEIFGARARTREGRLQVELAALTYQRSRLVRSWTHLERQRGGFGFMGGPGESQIEADRRQIDGRITQMRRELDKVVRTRDLQRSARRKVPYPVVALVGYTNAGKSTLFNRLTGASVQAEDQLFATLDPTMRRVALPSGQDVILSDTVGFIADLPTALVAAFRATLEEVVEADLIVHVRDITHPDTDAHGAEVIAVLGELGVEASVAGRVIEAHNKIDRLDDDGRAAARAVTDRRADAIALSARSGENVDALLTAIDANLTRNRVIEDYEIPLRDGAAIAWLYQNGEVVDRRDGERTARLAVGLEVAEAARFKSRFRYAGRRR